MDSEVLLQLKNKFIYKDDDGKLYRKLKDNLREVKPNVNMTLKFMKKVLHIPKVVWYLNTGEYPDKGYFGYRDGNDRNYSYNNLVALWNTNSRLTKVRLNELFHYDEATGDLYRKYSTPGSTSGLLSVNHADGYISVKINGKSYMAHRLIWIMSNGDIPDDYMIDHINHNRCDNRLSNLRLVTARENAQNMHDRKRNLPMGIQKKGSRYTAKIGDGKTNRHLGTYDTIEEAKAAWNAAKVMLGFHKNHGS